MTAAVDGPDGYVGRHAPDHIDPDTMACLVSMYLSTGNGDLDTAEVWCSKARLRLYQRGADTAQAMRAIHRVMPEVRERAKKILASLDELPTVEVDRG